MPLPLGFYDEVDHVSFEFEPQPELHSEYNTNTNTPTNTATNRDTNQVHAPKIHPYDIPTTSKPDLSLSARDPARPNLEVCTVRLWEKPGCSEYEAPLLQREFGAGAGVGGESRCVPRGTRFLALQEMFVKVDCVDGSIGFGGGSGRAHSNVTFSEGRANSTAQGTDSGLGGLGEWQRRRLGLLRR